MKTKNQKRTTIVLQNEIYELFNEYSNEMGYSSPTKFIKFLVMNELQKNNKIDLNKITTLHKYI